MASHEVTGGQALPRPPPSQLPAPSQLAAAAVVAGLQAGVQVALAHAAGVGQLTAGLAPVQARVADPRGQPQQQVAAAPAAALGAVLGVVPGAARAPAQRAVLAPALAALAPALEQRLAARQQLPDVAQPLQAAAWAAEAVAGAHAPEAPAAQLPQAHVLPHSQPALHAPLRQSGAALLQPQRDTAAVAAAAAAAGQEHQPAQLPLATLRPRRTAKPCLLQLGG